jgi:hypothetical protein
MEKELLSLSRNINTARQYIGSIFSRKKFSLVMAFLFSAIFVLAGFGPWSLLLGLIVLFSGMSLRIGVTFLLVFIPMKYLLQSLGIFSDSFMAVVSPLVTLVTVAGGYVYGVIPIKFKRHDNYLALFLIFSMISGMAFSIEFGFRVYQALDFMIFLQIVGFYLLGRLASKKDTVYFINLNTIIAIIVSIIGIIQFFFLGGKTGWLESFDIISFRAYGPLGNPNAFSGYLLMALIIWSSRIKFKEDFLIATPLVLGIFLSFSRGAVITMFITIFAFAVLNRFWKYIYYTVATSLVAVLLGSKYFFSRFLTLLNTDFLFNSSVSGRIWSLTNVIYINSQSWFSRLLGNGWGSYGGEYAYGNLSPTYAKGVQNGVIGVANTDNQWLQIYAQQGVLGVAAIGLFVLSVFRDYHGKSRLAYLAVAGSLLMIFIDVFQFYQISFLIFFGLGIMVATVKDA